MPKEQSRFHRALALLTFLILAAMGLMGGFDWYQIGYQHLAVFGLIFLALMGYGAIVQAALGGGNGGSP